MKEYDIFLPLRYNDGTPVEGRKLQAIKSELVDQFGGLTFFPQANQGFWKLGDVTYRDEIVVCRVLASNSRRARKYLADLKERLKADLKQEEILIVERNVDKL